jgi:predicted DNA-binding transcriptional regulator AlpA
MSEFLPITRVAERYATTKHSIYRWMREERGFPAPIRLPGETLRWRPSDLEAWESTRMVDLKPSGSAAQE